MPDDPFGEGVLSYERKEDDFILYSWGEDFDDDDGEGEEYNQYAEIDGDWIIWPLYRPVEIQKVGSDDGWEF